MHKFRPFVALFLPALVLASGTLAARADDLKLEGTWKLVVLLRGEDDFMIFNALPGDEPKIEVLSFQSTFREAVIGSTEVDGGEAVLTMTLSGRPTVFRGKVVGEGDHAGRVLGVLDFGGTIYAARLEPTDQEKVAPFAMSQIAIDMREAMKEIAPQDKLAKLDAIIEANAGHPGLSMVYSTIIRLSGDAELTPDQAKAYVDKWIAGAAPYGEEWLAETRVAALKAISGRPAFAAAALELASQADQALGPDASTESQSNVVSLYLSAARAAGANDLAAALEERLVKLDAILDAEYLSKVPPFTPEPYGGRASAEQNRIVVMELFTGAQCPPCVAADVGFDGLIQSYEPTELVALQYHLHIPGPDPLTSPASLGRAAYYGVRSTPSTFFNGKPEASGGGGMAQSKAKYDQYRSIIDPVLATKKEAAIELSVSRDGDSLVISAKAKVDLAAAQSAAEGAEKTQSDPPPEGTAENKAAEPQYRLRLVLTEETVRYVGSNKIRFHHHIVRAFPGGVEGAELAAGEGNIDLVLPMDDVRNEINAYVDQFSKNTGFPNPVPELKLEDLSVVALVQEDGSKNILHAVSVKVVGVE
jgi:hypothetical protein